MRLVELLKRNEGKTLEFKRDLSSSEGILKCLVAFANTAGGIVVIGVEDGSRNVRGVPDVLALEEKLANLVSDSIRPRLIPDIEVVPWRKLNVLAVQVYPSNTRPHYLERLGPEDGVFIRVGSTNRKAEALQIEELKRLNRMNSFDEQAIPDLKSEAIDFRAASELFAPYRQLTSQAWSTLRIITEHHGRGRCRAGTRTCSQSISRAHPSPRRSGQSRSCGRDECTRSRTPPGSETRSRVGRLERQGRQRQIEQSHTRGPLDSAAATEYSYQGGWEPSQPRSW